jgi:tetratricopeptide (TPR) repeat protein
MRKLLAVLVMMVAFAATASATGTYISGRVSYPNGAAAEFVRVQLWSDMIAFRTETNTDKQGKYIFQGVPNSTYHLLIEHVGYQDVQRNIDISMSGMAYEDIVLKPKPGTKPPDAAALPATIDARIAAITPDAKKEFDAGQKAMGSNDAAGAMQHFQKAVTLYPQYAEAYGAMGFVQMQAAQKAADLQAAEASELKAISIDKDIPNFYYILGLSRAMMGNTPAAEEPFTTLVTKDPTNPDGHFELAKTEFALNKFPDAELHARKAIELKEKNPGVQVVLAYALLRQQKAPEAKAAFQQYLKLDPNSPMKADVEKTIAMIEEHEKQGK